MLYALFVLSGGAGVEYHAASWINVVKYWVAWSNSSVSFIFMFIFMWSSMYAQKQFQFVLFVTSVGIVVL
jgi:hypothetical protein